MVNKEPENSKVCISSLHLLIYARFRNLFYLQASKVLCDSRVVYSLLIQSLIHSFTHIISEIHELSIYCIKGTELDTGNGVDNVVN